MKNPTPDCVPCCPTSTNDGNVHDLVIVLLVGLFSLLNVVFSREKKKEKKVEIFILKISEPFQPTLFLLREMRC